MLYNINSGEMVIAINGTTSNSIEVGKANALTVYTPATLTGTITLQGSNDNVTFYNIKSGGSNVTLAASSAYPLTSVGSKYIRVVSGSAEAAARTFYTTMQEQGNR